VVSGAGNPSRLKAVFTPDRYLERGLHHCGNDDGKPLFPGDSEIDELFSIFRVLGTPTEGLFPGVTQLPAYSDTFPHWQGKPWQEVIRGAEPDGIDLVQQMLKYDPTARISAKAALDHPYFADLSPEMKAKCRPAEID
jgi:serine/threonine protein kinase